MSEKSANLGEAVTTGGVLITACAVCCTPLVVTPLVGLFATGGAGLALAGQIGLGIVSFGGISGYLYLHRRAKLSKADNCGCDQPGECADSGAAKNVSSEGAVSDDPVFQNR